MEHVACQVHLAQEANPVVGCAVTVDAPDSLFAQVHLHIEGDRFAADPDVAVQIRETIGMAGLVGRALDMIEVPVHWLDVARALVFARNRVVQADIDRIECPLGSARAKASRIRMAHRTPYILGGPGRNPQRVGHVRRIHALDKLALQLGQGLVRVADQQGVGHVDHMPQLRLTQ